VLAKIAEMSAPGRTQGERLLAIITARSHPVSVSALPLRIGD
jgi:hypothetical protein